MTGYVISKDSVGRTFESSPMTMFATTDKGDTRPAHWTPIAHHARRFPERRDARRVLHAGGWHRHGWRVENARRYREAGQ